MKKRILTLSLIICLLPVFAYAGLLQQLQAVIAKKNGGAAPPSGIPCSGSEVWVGNPGADESFEYGADDGCCSETIVFDTDGIINTQDSSTKVCGTYSATFDFTDISENLDNYIYMNLGGDKTEFNERFYFRANLGTSSGTYAIINIWTISTLAGGVPLAHVKMRNTNGATYNLAVHESALQYSSVNLSQDTWYRLEIYHKENTADAGFVLKIYDLSNTLLDTISQTSLNQGGAIQYINHGTLYQTSAEADQWQTWYDDIRYDGSGSGDNPLGAQSCE